MFTREGDAGVHRHIQRKGSGPGIQPDERVCIPRGKRQPYADLSIEVNRRIRNKWCSFRKYTLELCDRPSAPLELKTRMLRAEVLETMLYGCVMWSPRASHYDTLRRVHHRFLTRCIGRRKHKRADHPIPIWTRCLSRREVRASRRLYTRGRSCLRDLWRAWRIRDCRSA